MASKIQAIGTYVPRIKAGSTVEEQELAGHIASRTGLNRSELLMALIELSEAVIFFNLMGRAVRLRGLGIYAPSVRLDGTLTVTHRLDPAIRRAINQPGRFQGRINNREHIGKTPEELVALWNAAHPDDPVQE